jgi:hypothetical protein
MLALGSDMSSDARACGEWDVDRDMLTDMLTDWCAPSAASGGESPTRAILLDVTTKTPPGWPAQATRFSLHSTFSMQTPK